MSSFWRENLNVGDVNKKSLTFEKSLPLIAAIRAVSKPPSAIRDETKRSVMNLLPVGMHPLPELGSLELGNNPDKARALSSGVGSKIIQLTCK